MAKKRKKYDDDDGRVIVNMNVEGMPWYRPGASSSYSENEDNENPHRAQDELTKKELFWLYFGAMRAGCVVALIAVAIVTVAGVIAAFALGVW